MSANDFFASLTKQAREKDRTVSKSSTVNSKAATISAPATDADTFFSSLNRQAQFIDRNGFTPKTLANVGNVSKEEASVAKTPLLSGYDERADDYDGLFGTLRGVGESALAGIRSANEALAGWLADVTPDAVKENISLVDVDQDAARAAASAASGAVQERFGRTEGSQEQGRERQQQATDYLTQRRNELDTGVDVERLFEEAANSQEEAARIREYTVGDSGAFAQLLFDAGVGGVQMGYDALVNFLIPGSGLASAGLRGAGSGILEAQQSGASTLEQLAYGLGVGAVEAATEKISNLAGPLRRVFGGGVADRAVSSLVNRLTSSTAGRALLNLAANAAGEGFEEFVSSAANPVLRRIFDENALAEYGDPQMWADAAYDALVGATIGGVLGGAGQVIENRANRRASQNVENNAPAFDSAGADVTEGNVTTRPTETAVEAPAASQAATEVETLLFPGNVSNNVANRIIDTPELRAQFESLTGQRLTGTKSEMRDTIKEFARQRAADAAVERFEADVAEMNGEGVTQTPQAANVSEIPNSSPVQGVNTPVMPDSSVVNPTDSLGAAPAGFGAEGDALTMQLEQAADAYGTMPPRNGLAREVPLPNSTDGNTRVMRTAQTLADAEAIDSTASGRVTDDVARGVYNYTPKRNADVMAEDLNQLAGQDLQSAAREWIVEASQNIVTRRTATRGVNLMRQAQAAGDYNLMSDLMAAFAQHQHNAASALQVSRMFWELPREMQLVTIQKSVDRLNAGEDAGYSRRQGRQIAGQDAARRMLRDMEQQRDDALNVLAEIANAYRGETETGEADWIGQIANGLAANLSSRFRTQRSGQMPIGRIMVQDMVRLAEQYALPRQRRGQTQRRSAIETLQNYIYNRAEYDAAWQRAQEEIRQRYQNNPEALAAFDEWLNSSAPYEGSAITQSPMFRAVAEEAAAQELSRNTAAVRAEYGDAPVLAADLANNVTSKLDGVTAQDQAAIYTAALEYVNSRTPTGNRTASDVVESQLRQAMRDAGVRMSEIIRQGASTKAEVASNLSQALVNEFGFSEQNAQTFAANVVDRFNAQVAEASQRALESRFRDRTATQRRSLAERLAELANMGAFSSDRYNSLATRQLFGRDLPPEISVDEDLIQNFMTAESAEAQVDALNAIYKNVAEQIPQNWSQKIDNWRYFMMLFNPETHLRNKLGNVAYTPIRGLDYRLSAFLQDRLIRDPEQRTRSSISRRNVEDEARYQAGLAEFDLVDSMYASPGKYNNARGGIRQNAPVQLPFGLERLGLGRLAELNSQALENADAKTSSKAYAYSLAQWLKAHNITAEQYLAPDFDPDLKAQAQGFALNEGRRATFRDVNDFINVLQQASHLRGNNPIVQAYNTAMSAVNPFARTGGNLIVRAAEHSPLGLARGTYNAMRYLWNQRNAVAEQRYSAGEVLDQITQGLTGTGVLLLGALLRHFGWITGGDAGDDKETEFAEQQGWQPYSLKIGDGHYSIDWLAPMALPLFTGVELYQQFWGDHAGDNDWLGALGRIADPMLEMSMMSSISGLFDSIAYADGNSLWPIAAGIASNYIGQFFPSIGGAIERIGTDTRQTTYTNPDGALPTDVQYTISNALNRVPGVDYQQTDYIDAWGRKEATGDALYRAFDNLANPGTYSADRSTEIDAELQRLYDVTGVDVFPSRVSPNETYTKKNNDGTVEEIHLADSGLYETYATTLGQTSLNELTELINSAAYQSMTDADKAVAVQAIYDYARDVARKAIDAKYEMSSKNEEAQEFAGGASTYFSFNTAWKAVEDSKGANTAAFEAVMQDYERMSTQKQNALMEALGEGTRFDDVVDAYEAGIDPERWYEAYDKHQELNENENLSANSAATEFAKWLDTESGFNANQRDVIEEQMRFWNMFPADTERYDALIDAGFTPEKADAVYDAVSALQPQQGKTQVSDLQRYEAIANMSGLTDAEKVQALTEYEGASSGDRQKFSTAYAYGISPELYVNMLEMQDEGVGDEDGNGRYKQDEAKLLIDTLMDSNSDMTTREAAILWAMLCPTSKTGNPYGNIYGSTSMEWDYAP